MAPSTAGALDNSAEDAKVVEALSLANKITMNNLTMRIQANPAADLGQLLSQQATTYPQLRDTLVQAAKNRCSQPVQATSSPAARQTQEDRHVLEDLFTRGSSTEVVLPLNIELKHMLLDAGTPPEGADQRLDDDLLGSALDRLIRTSDVIHELHNTFVLGLGPSVAVKIGTFEDIEEGANLLFLESADPKILAPSCLGCVKSRHLTYLFMRRIEGQTLDKVWPALGRDQKSSVQAQLDTIFKALRNAQHAQDSLGSFGSAMCKDMRRTVRTAPDRITDEKTFNDFLCSDPRRSSTPWIKMINGFMKDDHRIVMTHGDLHPRNIMVKWEADQEDAGAMPQKRRLKVTGIIDWDLSGWYPEYWEYVRALSTVEMKGPLADWCEFLPTTAIGEWPVEFSIDLLISRWIG